MQITTLPLYSKLADEAATLPEIAQRPLQGWRLSQHQVATYHALIDPNVYISISTAVVRGKLRARQVANDA